MHGLITIGERNKEENEDRFIKVPPKNITLHNRGNEPLVGIA